MHKLPFYSRITIFLHYFKHFRIFFYKMSVNKFYRDGHQWWSRSVQNVFLMLKPEPLSIFNFFLKPGIKTINVHQEKTLSRKTRATLWQLKSGRCKLLNNYLNKIDPITAHLWIECGNGPPMIHNIYSNASIDPRIFLWSQSRWFPSSTWKLKYEH